MAKILVADDNSNIQKMVGLALKDQGIDVVAVGNGEAAVRKISDMHPDLVLADVFMPVRNGYEVCKYVKEDSSLSHIPVILLVGAFDPLDEQEAQRVGADGVLKKPFVPPDPLISMVKSALMRAGVSLGPAASVAEKPVPVTSRTGADILSGVVGSKLQPPTAAKLPEAMPESVEDFPVPPAPVRIPEGNGPVAFGSLLGSTETEEDPAVFSSKPMINITAKHEWDDEPKDVPEEEDEEESTHSGGWHPSALDEVENAAAPSNGAPDWRDEAFHGSSPAKGQPAPRWTPTAEKTGIVEAAESPAVAVSTLTSKSSEGTSPFTGDAWAAAMAAGIEEKLAGSDAKTTPALGTHEVEASAHVHESLYTPPSENSNATGESSVAEAAPSVEDARATEPGNWAAVPEASWETQAKRAAMLASTWDAAATRSPDETQDVPVYKSEAISAGPVTVDEPAADTSAYSGHWEAQQHTSSASETASHETVQEPASEGAPPKSWENAWEAPASSSVSAVSVEPEIVRERHVEPVTEMPRAIASPAVVEHIAEHLSAPTEAVSQAVATPAATPNMDELVARVLSKMNPDVLQKVTREILKPVIEAIVRDELESKK